MRSHGWYDLPPFSYDREKGVLTTSLATPTAASEVTFRIRGGRLEARSDGLGALGEELEGCGEQALATAFPACFQRAGDGGRQASARVGPHIAASARLITRR